MLETRGSATTAALRDRRINVRMVLAPGHTQKKDALQTDSAETQDDASKYQDVQKSSCETQIFRNRVEIKAQSIVTP